MKKHFVVFCSPGTFFNETTEKSIDSWDVDKAVEMAKSVIERYNAIPFGFYFTTRERKKDELDSKKTKESGMYFLGGTIYTLKQIKDRNNPDDRILISNMENNGYNKIIENTNSWKIVQPFTKKDKLIKVDIRKKK